MKYRILFFIFPGDFNWMPKKNDSKSPVKYIIEITFGLDIQEGGSSALSIWLQGLFFMQFISQEKSG